MPPPAAPPSTVSVLPESDQVPLSRLLIAGHPAAESFSNFLKDNLYLPVEVADLSTVLDLGRHADALQDVTQQHAWYVPIGTLAISMSAR